MLAAAILIPLTLGQVAGQSPRPPADEPPIELRRIDDGVADRDSLSVSFRDPRVSLGGPSGFREVFSPYGRDDLFMRGSGAVYATFRRSAYTKNKENQTVILVPGGTVFSIGLPRMLPSASEATTEGAKFTPEGLSIAASSARREAGSSANSMASPFKVAGYEPMADRLDHTLRGESAIASVRADGPLEVRLQEAPSGGPRSTQNPTRRPGDVAATERDVRETTHLDIGDAAHAWFAGETLPRFLRDEAYRRTRLDSLLATFRETASSSAPSAPSGEGE